MGWRLRRVEPDKEGNGQRYRNSLYNLYLHFPIFFPFFSPPFVAVPSTTGSYCSLPGLPCASHSTRSTHAFWGVSAPFIVNPPTKSPTYTTQIDEPLVEQSAMNSTLTHTNTTLTGQSTSIPWWNGDWKYWFYYIAHTLGGTGLSLLLFTMCLPLRRIRRNPILISMCLSWWLGSFPNLTLL
jgi:hypothetical protein